jgi:hypothetical protein
MKFFEKFNTSRTVVQKFSLAYIYRTEGLALKGEIKVNYIFQIY